MRSVSLFSGVGAASLAVEAHFGAAAVAFVEQDKWAQAVLRRHNPGVLIFDDVRAVGAHNLPAHDILEAGFPCQDLSAAGRQAGLDGERSGLYSEVLRIAGECLPRFVFIENVPALLKYRGRLEQDFARIGYGLTWAKVAAQHVEGCPHRRLRVFVLAELGGRHQGVCDAGPLPPLQACPTPPASVSIADGESPESWNARYERNGTAPGTTFSVGTAVRMPAGGRPWPTPTLPGGGAKTRSGSRSGERLLNGAVLGVQWPTPRACEHKGNGYQRKGDALFPTLTGATGAAPRQPQAWPTPAAQEPGIDPARLVDKNGNPPDSPMQRCYDRETGRLAQTGLVQAVGWSTPCADDDRDRGDVMSTPAVQRRVGKKQLNLSMQAGGRLSPLWVETLMGLPVGYTSTDGPPMREQALRLMRSPQWPAPMVKGLWGDSLQHGWEPPRTVPKGWGAKGERAARLKCLGNTNCPQQYLLALQLLQEGPRQASLFGLLDGPAVDLPW